MLIILEAKIFFHHKISRRKVTENSLTTSKKNQESDLRFGKRTEDKARITDESGGVLQDSHKRISTDHFKENEKTSVLVTGSYARANKILQSQSESLHNQVCTGSLRV